MARIAIFIDHDIIVRHFVLSGVLAPLTEEHDVVFVFPEKNRRVTIDVARLPIPRYRTVPVSDTRSHLYRRLYHATLLRNIRSGPNTQTLTSLWRDILGRRAFWTSWLCSLPVTYQAYRAQMLRRIGEHEALDRLLVEERPDVIVHPTVLEGLFVSDLVRWGKRHRTPTVFIANSWDNASTRVMLAGHPDRLVVWGSQTHNDAVEHMGTPADRIRRLGAAQFDLYRRAPRMAGPAYRRMLGVPEGAQLLLYAGSSKGLDETRHLLMLERAIEGGELKDCFVVYRPHPWRGAPAGEEDFFSLTWKHVVLEPAMEASYRRSRREQGMDVELADYEDTHVALSAVDAVVSPLSTILLEAALHGKPVAVYLPDENMAGNKFMYEVAKMRFFKEFFERVPSICCESPSRFIADCRTLLRMADDPGISVRLKQACAYFVEPSDRPYAERLRAVIAETVPSGQGAHHAAI